MAKNPSQEESARRVDTEVRVRFDKEELERFFAGFAPMSPLDLLDEVLGPPEPIAPAA